MLGEEQQSKGNTRTRSERMSFSNTGSPESIRELLNGFTVTEEDPGLRLTWDDDAVANYIAAAAQSPSLHIMQPPLTLKLV